MVENTKQDNVTREDVEKWLCLIFDWSGGALKIENAITFVKMIASEEYMKTVVKKVTEMLRLEYSGDGIEESFMNDYYDGLTQRNRQSNRQK